MTDFNINPNDKFYPEANEWMWDYCTFLGKFTDSKGENFDLGILLDRDDNKFILGDWSAAIVYGNTPGNYISGGNYDTEREPREFMKEMIRRAKILNLIK